MLQVDPDPSPGNGPLDGAPLADPAVDRSDGNRPTTPSPPSHPRSPPVTPLGPSLQDLAHGGPGAAYPSPSPSPKKAKLDSTAGPSPTSPTLCSTSARPKPKVKKPAEAKKVGWDLPSWEGKEGRCPFFECPAEILMSLPYKTKRNPYDPHNTHPMQLFTEAAVEALALRVHGGVVGHQAHLAKLAATAAKAAATRAAKGHVPKSPARRATKASWAYSSMSPRRHGRPLEDEWWNWGDEDVADLMEDNAAEEAPDEMMPSSWYLMGRF